MGGGGMGFACPKRDVVVSGLGVRSAIEVVEGNGHHLRAGVGGGVKQERSRFGYPHVATDWRRCLCCRHGKEDGPGDVSQVM